MTLESHFRTGIDGEVGETQSNSHSSRWYQSHMIQL